MNCPKTLTAVESDVLISELTADRLESKADRKAVRNVFLTVLMLDAGLRVGEVVQLRVSDLWLANESVNSIFIRSEIAKNKTERRVPVTVRVKALIQVMFGSIWDPYNYKPDDFCFPAPSSMGHISTRQVERILEKAGRVALGFPVNPHMLRHTFASRLMRVTNARTVQQLLGHKNLNSTQIYTHPNSDDLQNAINAL